MLGVLRELRDEMIADLMARLRAGKINARNLESQQRSKFRKFSVAKARVGKVLGQVGRAGRSHAAEEIQRFDASLGG